MLIDAREVPDRTIIETEVCIVGAGAAGITLAREFAGAPFRVCLLESGGLEYDDDTQDLYKGRNVGRHYYELDACRLRYFGGTTNHWSGWCGPLEPIDFEQRHWVPYSGWPFGYRELEPFYLRAQEICQLGPYGYDANFWKTLYGPESLLESERVVMLAAQFSPPTRFGEEYRSDIEAADNVSAYLHANVVMIETHEMASEVTGVRVASLGGNRFGLVARYFILAAGGIENARLLLVSNGVQTAGLGNHHDLVGRFFMEHPQLDSGVFLPTDVSESRWGLFNPWSTDEAGWTDRGRVRGIPLPILTLQTQIQERERILNSGITFAPEFSVPEGWEALREILRPMMQGRVPDEFGSNIRDVIADLDGTVASVFRRLTDRPPPFEKFWVHGHVQQAPNPESRVTLSNEPDALGLPRPILDWRLSKSDKRSIRRTVEIVGQELARIGLGRMKLELSDDEGWPVELRYGNHHMGTTRMNADPKAGVVDAECRVHGISNLYVAGSSVFPTGGSTGPTFTIVAMALRLADHVKGLIM